MSFQSGSIDKNGLARTIDGKLYVAIGSTSSVAVPVAQSAIPFIKASSGTMGDNGAISGLTALPTTYSGGAYIYLPAAAIEAGSLAGWYWFVASSTTAGTVYNSTYTSGIPAVGVATAFVSTGPGAFTGVTSAVTGPQYTLTGGSIGTRGFFRAEEKWSVTNNASAKTKTLNFGATGMSPTTSLASTLNWQDRFVSQNRGSQSVQITTINSGSYSGLGASGSGFLYRTVDTSANVTVSRVMTGSGAATDNIILEGFVDEVAYLA